MREIAGKYEPGEALGIFVELSAGTESVFRYRIQELLPYRVKLLISLPPGMEKSWAAGIWRILKKVEAGSSWPLRFEYANVTRFISMEELERIDNCLPDVTVYLYGKATETAEASFDQDILRRWINSARRDAYVSRSRAGCKPHQTPLDGQITFDAS